MNSLDANIRTTKTKGELNSLRDNGNVPAPNTIPWDTKASGLYMICTLSKHEAENKCLLKVQL